MSAGGFVHLRVRSAYSLLEGAIRAGDLGKLAHKAGMPAIGIADRSNLFGALEFSQTCKEVGVQPILGCAIPVSGLGGRALQKWARWPTLMLLAQDEVGWRHLTELSSKAFLDVDATSDPQVPWTEIVARAEGLILLSGGPDGPIDPLFRQNRTDEARHALDCCHQAFGDRFYIELQRHTGCAYGGVAGSVSENGLVRFAYDHDIPLVATNDVYFATSNLYDSHEALIAISDGAFLGQADRRKVTPDHWLKPPDDMRTLFADLPEACDSTLEIARRCAYLENKRDPILPSFPTDAGRNEAEEMAYQAKEGLKERLRIVKPAMPETEYWERLDREIGVINRMGFAGYFLIVSDFIKWAKTHDIPVGPGRGSGAGSFVAWALTITDLDPLRFGLLFERFLNPERVSMPDFDIDFCQERREEVIAYVQQKYGRDRVAQIITFGSLQARAVLRDVGRVMQLPLGQVDRLAKMVPNNPASPTTLAQAIEIEPRLKQAAKDEDTVKHLLETAIQLEGLYRNASTHAAGIVISDRPLTELVPLYRDPRSDIPATQYNMKWVESAGLVKFDFLGLKTLTVLNRVLGYLRKRDIALDLITLPLDDKPTYDMLAGGQSVGVFQLESQGMRDTLRKMRCGSIEEITALISLYRPGPMDNIDTYVDRKFGRVEIDMLHPSLEPVLKETYGVIIYQEQVMQIAQILSGYSLGEADLLRRAMGKKKKEEMDLQKARFISGAKERAVPDSQADLKANYPVEFMAASMSLDIANTDKLAVFYQEARRSGIRIRPPSVNRSRADFDVADGEVLYALGAVRNVGFEAMMQLVAERERQGPFKDLFDFLERIDPKNINKRALENLAKAGAFDDIHPNRAEIVQNVDLLIAYAQSVAADRASSQVSLFGKSDASRPRLTKPSSSSASSALDDELFAIGFYLSGHPLQDMVDVFTRRHVTLYAEALSMAQDGFEAFRMAGVVRRRQERASSQTGEKFAFVTLSDPTGEYEVLFQPEALRKYRDRLEPGNSIVARIRCRGGREGEVRFFGEEAILMQDGLRTDDMGLKIFVSSANVNMSDLKACIEAAQHTGGGEIIISGEIRGNDHETSLGHRVDVKLPLRYRLDVQLRSALKTVAGVQYVEDV